MNKEPLQQQQKDEIKNLIEDKIGRNYEGGVHANILREVTLREAHGEDDGSYYTVVKAVIEASSLDVQDIPFKILTVDHKEIEGYRDGFEIQLSGYQLEERVRD